MRAGTAGAPARPGATAGSRLTQGERASRAGPGERGR